MLISVSVSLYAWLLGVGQDINIEGILSLDNWNTLSVLLFKQIFILTSYLHVYTKLIYIKLF